MKKNIIFILLLFSIFSYGQLFQKEFSNPVQDVPIEALNDRPPMSGQEVYNQALSIQDQKKEDFRWHMANDYMLWSAIQNGTTKRFAIGYVPEDNLNNSGTSPKLLIDFILQTNNESSLTAAEQITKESLNVEYQKNIPVFYVDLSDYETLAQLRRLPTVRYIEPMSFSLEQFNPAFEIGENNQETAQLLSSDGCSASAQQIYNHADSYTVYGEGFNSKIPWNFKAQGIEKAWKRSNRGAGIGIAIFDTGIANSQVLLNGQFATGLSSGRSITVKSTYDNQTGTDDLCGHGTTLAGQIAAPVNSNSGITGVAHRSNLYAYRVGNDVTLNTQAQVHAVANAMSDVVETGGIRIVNISLGKVFYSDLLYDAMVLAEQNGIMVIAAIGTGAGVYPAKHSNTIAITAVKYDPEDDCEGINLDASGINAIGLSVNFAVYLKRSEDGRDALGMRRTDSWPRAAYGTSSATAISTGIAALVWSNNPSLNKDQVYQIMRNAASHIVHEGEESTFFGNGVIDVEAAVIAANPNINTSNLEDASGTEKYAFCMGEDVFLDERWVDFNGPFFIELTIPGPNGPIFRNTFVNSKELNITDLFENHEFPVTFESNLVYSVKFAYTDPDCGWFEVLNEFTYLETDESLSFTVADESGTPRELFCSDEVVFIENDNHLDIANYFIEVKRRPHGTSNWTYLLLEELENSNFNLTTWLLEQNTTLDAGYDYSIKLAVQTSCDPWTEKIRVFSVQSDVLTSEFHFEDNQQNLRESFCASESVFLNGSASEGEVRYYFSVGKAPLGSEDFDYVTDGWTYTSINTINFSQWMTSQGTPLEGDFNYQVKMGTQNDCNPWAESTRRFIFENCCEAPSDLTCTTINGRNYLTWESVPSATGYLLYVDPTSSCCGNADDTTPDGFFVATNQYNVRNIGHECFQWRVAAICGDDEVSPLSEPACYSAFTPCFGLAPLGQDDNAKAKAWTPVVSPNPSNGETTIEMHLEVPTSVSISIFDINGQRIHQSPTQQAYAGTFKYTWTADARIGNGIYFIEIHTDEEVFQKKLLINK